MSIMDLYNSFIWTAPFIILGLLLKIKWLIGHKGKQGNRRIQHDSVWLYHVVSEVIMNYRDETNLTKKLVFKSSNEYSSLIHWICADICQWRRLFYAFLFPWKIILLTLGIFYYMFSLQFSIYHSFFFVNGWSETDEMCVKKGQQPNCCKFMLVV